MIPILDMRERCGLEKKKYNKKTPILILNYMNFQIGLIVDSANNIIKLERDKIQYPPNYNALIDKNFINGLRQVNIR